MKDEALKDLSESRTRNITANAVRQARFAERMRAEGKKKLTLWVTKEEEQFIRAGVLGPQRGEKLRAKKPDFMGQYLVRTENGQ